MAIRRPSRLISERQGPVAHLGETMRSPEHLKVIDEALGEPEGAARQSARMR